MSACYIVALCWPAGNPCVRFPIGVQVRNCSSSRSLTSSSGAASTILSLSLLALREHGTQQAGWQFVFSVLVLALSEGFSLVGFLG